jgi:hypothetical protein
MIQTIKVILFWVVFAIAPLKYASVLFFDGSFMIIYYVVILPVLFIFLFKVLNIKERKNKIVYFIFAVIVPLIILYSYLYAEFLKDFNPKIL